MVEAFKVLVRSQLRKTGNYDAHVVEKLMRSVGDVLQLWFKEGDTLDFPKLR